MCNGFFTLQEVTYRHLLWKEDKSDCGNYRGIALLSTAGKIIARILLNRLPPLAEEFLPESQCGFRPSRGTADMIFTARQLQEKCREQHQPLYMAFFDLTNCRLCQSRSAVEILLKNGCPPKFVATLRLLHDNIHPFRLKRESSKAVSSPQHSFRSSLLRCSI